MQLSAARTANLIEQDLGNELLIYDLRINKACSLNETSAIVYKACGEWSFEDLKREYKFTDDLIHFALDELDRRRLLENYRSGHFSGMNRREVVKRVDLANDARVADHYRLDRTESDSRRQQRQRQSASPRFVRRG